MTAAMTNDKMVPGRYLRCGKPRTVGSLVDDFKGNTWRVVSEPELVSGFNGATWFEFLVERA